MHFFTCVVNWQFSTVSYGPIYCKNSGHKCCSDACAKMNYKKRVRDQKLESAQRLGKDEIDAQLSGPVAGDAAQKIKRN